MYLLPIPDLLTDEEDFIDENNMENNEINDVVGTLEFCITSMNIFFLRSSLSL